MPVVVIALLTVFLSTHQFALAKQDGPPDRRVGGGTRYEAPQLPIIG